jgi:hypothetical protein
MAEMDAGRRGHCFGRLQVDATRWVAVAENSVREVSGMTQSHVSSAIGKQFARRSGVLTRGDNSINPREPHSL